MAKQVLVMRKDLGMKKGKSTAQGAHASLGAILQMMNNGDNMRDNPPEIIDNAYTLSLKVEVGSPMDDWLMGIFRKVALGVKSEEELMVIHKQAVEAGLPVSLITDSGLTQFKGIKTVTCLAIGPAAEDEIDSITGHLPLY